MGNMDLFITIFVSDQQLISHFGAPIPKLIPAFVDPHISDIKAPGGEGGGLWNLLSGGGFVSWLVVEYSWGVGTLEEV